MKTLYEAPQHSHRSPPATPRLGTIHDALLQALLTYVYLTSELARRALGYRLGSLTYVRAAFKALEDAGFVRRVYLGRQTPGGSSKKVFTLSARGLAYLRRAGLPTWPRYHAQEQVEVGTLHLRHHLGAASFLLAAGELCRRVPDLALERVMAERALRREFRAKVTVTAADGRARTVAIAPDGYAEVRRGAHLMPIALEYDRATEARRAWQEKVAGLLAYADGPFQSVSGRRSLTIAVLTPHSEKRRRDLLAWTASALPSPEQADLFRVAFADPDTIDPVALFLSPLWFRPRDTTPTPLLAGLLTEPKG